MQRALVTGGLGFLGSAIVRSLRQREVAVRVLALPNEPTDNLEGEAYELVRGDVLDLEACRTAMDGVDTLFHCAALYKAFMPDPRRMYEVNLRGTFNMLEAARRAGVTRTVYTASIVSIGRPPKGRLADESTPYEAWDVDMPYSRSKYHSREVAESFASWGMDVRIVCPGAVFGPGDIAPTPSGKIIINTLKQRGPAVYTAGGTSYVDVRDAAEVHVLAATRGRAGERYIATAHNLDNGELMRAILDAAGDRRALRRLPSGLVRHLVRGMERAALRRGAEPPVASNFYEFSLTPGFYSNEKSRLELGASYRPLGETLRDALDYFRARGLLR
ncbi:MAG: NAD-dependent epimerase/dehydratase family protein [Polyangiaceae bacterium]|nr:NAD-dependent epimerase/dehydratase family protein [Polyangiaceae bacterium]